MSSCNHCNGIGKVRIVYDNPYVPDQVNYRVEACQHCEGKGSTMGKSVFDQKWHRGTLFGARQQVIQLESEFLVDHGWRAGTIANLGLSAGIVTWYKTINGVQCMCDKDTALEIAHAELFDKGPSAPAPTYAPMEPATNNATEPAKAQSEQVVEVPVASGPGGRYA